MEEPFSLLIYACRTNYSSQRVIIRLLEEWRKKLDDNFVGGAVLNDLPKAFDCIPHDLSIAKLAAYGLIEEALMYILSYLSNRKNIPTYIHTYIHTYIDAYIHTYILLLYIHTFYYSI